MSPSPKEQRPFIGVQFRCAAVYARFYQSADGSSFSGHCPRCLHNIQIKATDLTPGSKNYLYDCGRNRRPLSGNY